MLRGTMTTHARKKLVLKNSKTMVLRSDSNTQFIRTSDSKAQEKIEETIAKWKAEDRIGTKKAVFDYISDDRLFYTFLFGLVFFVVGGISMIFLTDGIQTHRCTEKLIREDAELAQATITKIKKNRRGNIVWDLNFVTKEGAEIKGRRTAIVPESANYTPGKKEAFTTVVYAPNYLECWDISLKMGEKHLPLAQRRFSASFTMGFGSFFAIAWLALSLFLWKRTTVRRPFMEELKVLYEKI